MINCRGYWGTVASLHDQAWNSHLRCQGSCVLKDKDERYVLQEYMSHVATCLQKGMQVDLMVSGDPHVGVRRIAGPTVSTRVDAYAVLPH